MNVWLVFAAVFLSGMLPGIAACMRGRMLERIVALQMVQVLAVIVMLLMAEGYRRDIYFDMALTLSLLSFAASLVFIRFMERWL
ncbi:MAG TPA: MrpF/PhaF family protein [Dissulfurispiraceae bacterium]